MFFQLPHTGNKKAGRILLFRLCALEVPAKQFVRFYGIKYPIPRNRQAANPPSGETGISLGHGLSVKLFQPMKFFAIYAGLFHSPAMTKPLALVFYSNLLPGSQLANRLQDLGYRVQTVSEIATLEAAAEREKPLVLLAEISRQAEACAAIAQLKTNPATRHIPVLAFAAGQNKNLQAAAQKAGASLLASNAAVLEQLPQLLEQILQVD